MDICIVDTRRQAKGVRGDFDKIFVLREVFRDTESSVSVPAGLDGTTTKARDQVIELLGELMDPKLLNSTHSHVFKKTGFKPASFSSLFELNIFSRFREYALFISLNEACSAIKALGTARSISIKSEVNGISDYVVKQFPGTEVLLLNKRKSKWQIAAEQYFLIAREFTKALIWWAYLVLASSLARREKEVPNGEIQVWQHRNPKLPKNPDREPWGRHWKALPDIETLFAHSPHPVSFSSGSFFTPLGQRIRHISVLELSRISFLVLKICLSSPVNHQKYLRAFSTRADSASSFAEILFAPITKSLVGPSFIQGLWDCLVLSKFFEQTSPKAIFFLSESQPWESCLMIAARRMQKVAPKLIGIAHTAVRPWDLRYFRPLNWFSCDGDSMPLPDKLLVTSPYCEERLKNHWSHVMEICLVETLRYPFKHALGPSSGGVLLAMPYTTEEEIAMTKLAKALRLELDPEPFKVQPHPLRRSPSTLPTANLSSFVPSLFLTDTTSTVIIDSVEAGIPTVAIHCGELPNMSVLADHKEFQKFHLVFDLRLARQMGFSGRATFRSPKLEYYCRSASYSRWNSLIRDLEDAF